MEGFNQRGKVLYQKHWHTFGVQVETSNALLYVTVCDNFWMIISSREWRKDIEDLVSYPLEQ